MKEILLKTVTVLLTVTVLIPLLMLWQGLAVSILWDWYVTPFGIDSISVPLAAGLCLLLSLMRMRSNRKHDSNADRFEAIASHIIIPPVAVFMGWVIKTFA